MMQSMIMICILLNSILFTQMSHPLSMGLILLLQTLLTSFYTGIISKSVWFSYILFLIFVGSMLILFIYMSSLSPNEKITFSAKSFIKLTIIITPMMILTLVDKTYLMSFYNTEIMNQQNNHLLFDENLFNLSKLYENPNNTITIMLVIYLLLTLVVVVKITNSFMGPLRQKNYE